MAYNSDVFQNLLKRFPNAGMVADPKIMEHFLDPTKGGKSITLKSPVGETLNMGFATPATQPAAAPSLAPAASNPPLAQGVRGGVGQTPVPESLQTIPTPPAPTGGAGGFNLGEALSSPGVANILATLGQSLTAQDPNSFGYQLGGAARQSIQNQLFQRYLQQLQGGGTSTPNPNMGGGLSSFDLSALPVEMQVAAQQQVDRQRQLASDEAYKAALGINALSQETPEQRFQREVTLQLLGQKPAEPKAPTTISLTRDKSGRETPGQFHEWAWNPNSGQFDQYVGPAVRPPTEGSGGGADPGVQQRLWYKMALDDAYRQLSLDGYGDIVTDANGEISGIKWKNPSEAKTVFRQYLGRSVSDMQRQKLLPSPFLGISSQSQQAEGPPKPAQSAAALVAQPPVAGDKIERARAFLKSRGKEGNDAQIKLFLTKNPGF